MSKRETRRRNKKIIENHPKVTLQDLIDKGIIDKYYHLQEQRRVGGLTMPKKNNTDWWKKLDELSSE